MPAQYAAGWNTPGYSPNPDNVHDFDSAADAWLFLRDTLKEFADDPMADEDPNDPGIENALQEMSSLADTGTANETVYSPEPGRERAQMAWWVHVKEDLGWQA